MKTPESSPYHNVAHWTIFSRKMEILAIQLITRFYITVGVATDFALRLRLVHRQLSAAWRLAEFANITFFNCGSYISYSKYSENISSKAVPLRVKVWLATIREIKAVAHASVGGQDDSA